MNRNQEYLERIYANNNRSIVAVYNSENVDYMGLIKDFSHGRTMSYFYARNASLGNQLLLWQRELGSKGCSFGAIEDPVDILKSLYANPSLKNNILVIENFERIIKEDSEFIRQIHDSFDYLKSSDNFIVILLSHDAPWLENKLISEIGDSAAFLSGILKLKPLSFYEIGTGFRNKMPFQELLFSYAVTGGEDGLLREFSPSRTFKDNICRLFLSRDGKFAHLASDIMDKSLREPTVYNTILSSMANEDTKLNDIHNRTGYSRSLISVYLRNLLSLEYIGKYYSYGNTGHGYSKKGIYFIKNPVLNFYFSFIYPNESSLMMMPADKFYDIFISSEIIAFADSAFRDVCYEWLVRKSLLGTLPIELEEDGRWLGKNGNKIDIVAQDNVGGTICCRCIIRGKPSEKDFNELSLSIKDAGLLGEKFYYYFFSLEGFDKTLIRLAQNEPEKIGLIDMEELVNG